MNSVVGPIFNIYILNKVVVGPMNSAITIQTRAGKKKEKKKKEKRKEM